MNWQQWLMQASTRLRAASTSAKLDAEMLLEQVTNVARTKLLAFGDTKLNSAQCTMLEKLLLRREQGEPVAYLIGECEFWSQRLQVSSATMIPRPDTECLVQRALELRLQPAPVDVLDLGTGTGAIALALASERPAWRITGIDMFPDVVALARANTANLGLNNIQFLEGDWCKPLKMQQRYSLIVSNPPYIESGDPHLLQGDVRYEPRRALVAGNDGMQYLVTLSRQVRAHLIPGGWLLLEHGWQQGEAVRNLLKFAGFSHIATLRDYGQHERVTQGQWLT